jgi:sugar-specific transcriptional regulator TrmB
MPGDTDDRPWDTAVEQLEAFGLSAYAARTYVALVRLENATARDVSDTADVPRTRVYDAVDELRGYGLVDVQHSSPKQFWAVSPEATGRYFDREYSTRVNRLTSALDALSPAERSSEQRGVWTATGREAVADRVVDFVADAEEEVVFTTAEELLTENVVDALATASDRGVSIRFAPMSEATKRRLADRLPDADTFESIWDWSDTPAGRLLMVDGERTLVSVLVEGEHPPGPRDETAIWGAGSTNGLVVVLKTMFTWQLDRE